MTFFGIGSVLQPSSTRKRKVPSQIGGMIIERKRKHPIQNSVRLVVFAVAVTVLFMTMLLNWLYMDPLYWEGVNMIYHNQQRFSSPFFVVLNNLFSMLCHPSTVSFIMLFEILIIRHKLKAYIHVSFFMLCIYIIALLKLVFQQSRPIWSTDRIQKLEWFCPKDFGNPSGHSFAIFPLYEPIVASYIGFGQYGLSWSILFVFGFCVPFSRTYLGVHSVNQILFGLTLGVTATLMYRYSIRYNMYKIFARIYKLKLPEIIISIVFLHLVGFMLPFLFYEMYSDWNPMDSEDVAHLNEFCLTDLNSLLIQESMLLKCTLESFIFGLAYGLYFSQYQPKQLLYFCGRWEYKSCKAAFCHLMAIVATLLLIGLIFVLLLPHFIKNTFFDYLVNSIGMTLAGFSLIYIVPKIEEHFEWIQFQRYHASVPSRNFISDPGSSERERQRQLQPI